MNTPIIDLEELLDEAKDRIEEKLIIEGELKNEYCANLSYGFPEEFLQNIAIFRNDIVRKEK